MKHNSITNIYFFSWAGTKLGISWCLFHHRPPPPLPPEKTTTYPKENKTLEGHPPSLAVATVLLLMLVSIRVSLPKPSPLEIILLELKGFLLMSWWLSLLWACSTLDCVLFLWEETPVHFKGAADTQGVSRNKTLTLCLSSFPLSLLTGILFFCANRPLQLLSSVLLLNGLHPCCKYVLQFYAEISFHVL